MKIKIEKYNPAWKETFAQTKQLLSNSLDNHKPIIEHIGSTSVEGLSAKPIID